MKLVIVSLLFITSNVSCAIYRKDVPEQDRWDLSALYSSSKEWQREYDALVKRPHPPLFPELTTYKGLLGNSAQHLHDTLWRYFNIGRKINKLACYTSLKHDEDITDTDAKTAYNLIRSVGEQFSQETSWIFTEILSLPEETLQFYIHDDLLAEYRFVLEKILHQKPHTQDECREELIALAESSMKSSLRTYIALTEADLEFGTVLNYELTQSSYDRLIRSPDRELRKMAYSTLFKKYLQHENTLTELLAGTIQAHLFLAKARNFSSCLEAELKPKKIDPAIYTSLIQTVRERINILHRYIALRKKILSLGELHPYDLKVPLFQNKAKTYSFDEACELVLEATRPLGKTYTSALRHGLSAGRWVDRYENVNKVSGAYSGGCYDSVPYILMNFNGNVGDVFTLAHEVGHSMHSYFSLQAQAYHNYHYETFVAEVASTFNEELLHQHLLNRAKNEDEKKHLIDVRLAEIEGGFFRQVLFAEFELFMHEAQEARRPLTPKLLKDKYLELFKFYYGSDLTCDPETAIEWALIPHLHLNFYVYQYATGISCALHLVDKVLHGTEVERERYLKFLHSGSSDWPLNLLQNAGCDMGSRAPIDATIDHFNALLDQLEHF